MTQSYEPLIPNRIQQQQKKLPQTNDDAPIFDHYRWSLTCLHHHVRPLEAIHIYTNMCVLLVLYFLCFPPLSVRILLTLLATTTEVCLAKCMSLDALRTASELQTSQANGECELINLSDKCD